jgi:hypothetical protein
MTTLFSNLKHTVDATSTVIALMGKEIYSIRDQKQGAATDTKGTIWREPLPDNATEEDANKYFCNMTHEGAHNTEGSDCDLMSKLKMVHHYENCIDDIRVESMQELKYKGLKKYRVENLKILGKEFLINRFQKATMSNLPDFIDLLGVFTIAKIRAEQLKANINWEPSNELNKAYYKYIADLEPKINSMKYFNNALSIAHIIIKRLDDLIKEAKKQEQQKKQESKKDSSNNDDSSSDGDPSKGKSSNDDDSSNDGDPSSDGDPSNDDDDPSNDDGDPSKGKSSNDDDDPSNDDDDPSKGKSSKGDDPSNDDDDPIDLDKAIKEINDQMEPTDLQEIVRKQIKDNAKGLYQVSPDVKDHILENRSTNDFDIVNSIKADGIKLLGSAGTKMTQYMISQSRMRTLSSVRSGKLDMLSLNSDVHNHKTNIYNREIKGASEKAAVYICIDHSRSMAGNRILIAYRVLSGILYHLDKSNVPCEATGFTASPCDNSKHRDRPVILSIIKRFNESFKGKALQRCIQPYQNDMYNTSEIDCMYYAVPRLMERKESKKILFMIGDGEPNVGNHYLNEKNMESYRTYIRKCKEAGIIVFGFGISCDLSRFFGDDCINVNCSTMGNTIAQKLTEVLNKRR